MRSRTGGDKAPGLRCGTLKSKPIKQPSPHGPHLLENGIGLRKLSGRFLAVDDFAVDRDFEHATAHRDKGEGLDVLFQAQELFRQTDGLRLVVSKAAILDADFQGHDAPTLKSSTRTVKDVEC